MTVQERLTLVMNEIWNSPFDTTRAQDELQALLTETFSDGFDQGREQTLREVRGDR